MQRSPKLPSDVFGALSYSNSDALDVLVTKVLLETEQTARSSSSNCTVSNQTFKPTVFDESYNLNPMLKRKADDQYHVTEAKRLRSFLESLNEKINELKMFRSEKYIMQYFSGVKLQLRERTKKAMKELNDIRTEKLKQIAEYQKQNLRINEQKAFEQNKTEKEGLSADIDAFYLKTSGYLLSNNDFTTAYCLEKRILLLKDKRRIDAFNGEPLNLHYSDLLSDRNHLFSCFNLDTREEPEVVLNRQDSYKLKSLRRIFDGILTSVNCCVFIDLDTLATSSSDKSIKLWNVKEGWLLFKLEGHSKQVYTLVVISPGILVSGSEDCSIIVWDLFRRTKIHTLLGHTGSVVSIKLMKNGLLASYSIDDSIKIWNPYWESGQPLMTIKGHENEKLAIPFGVLSDDRIVTATCDYSCRNKCIVKVWDPKASEELMKTVQTGHKEVWSLVVLQDDRVALGFLNGTIKLLDLLNDANSRTQHRAHTYGVTALAQFNNGNLVSAGTEKGLSLNSRTIKIWAMPDLILKQKIDSGHVNNITSLNIATGDAFVASAGMDSIINVWEIRAD